MIGGHLCFSVLLKIPHHSLLAICLVKNCLTVVSFSGVEPQGHYGCLWWKALFVCVGGARCGRECNHYMYLVLFRPHHEQQPSSSSRTQGFIESEYLSSSAVNGLRGGSPRTGPVDCVDSGKVGVYIFEGLHGIVMNAGIGIWEIWQWNF